MRSPISTVSVEFNMCNCFILTQQPSYPWWFLNAGRNGMTYKPMRFNNVIVLLVGLSVLIKKIDCGNGGGGGSGSGRIIIQMTYQCDTFHLLFLLSSYKVNYVGVSNIYRLSISMSFSFIHSFPFSLVHVLFSGAENKTKEKKSLSHQNIHSADKENEPLNDVLWYTRMFRYKFIALIGLMYTSRAQKRTKPGTHTHIRTERMRKQDLFHRSLTVNGNRWDRGIRMCHIQLVLSKCEHEHVSSSCSHSKTE